jgi:hypothetical protein
MSSMERVGGWNKKKLLTWIIDTSLPCEQSFGIGAAAFGKHAENLRWTYNNVSGITESLGMNPGRNSPTPEDSNPDPVAINIISWILFADESRPHGWHTVDVRWPAYAATRQRANHPLSSSVRKNRLRFGMFRDNLPWYGDRRRACVSVLVYPVKRRSSTRTWISIAWTSLATAIVYVLFRHACIHCHGIWSD